MAKFEVKIRARVSRWQLREGITGIELAWALKEVYRIAEKDHPDLDYTIETIAQTNHKWYRQKPEGAKFRTILVFRFVENTIVVEAVLRRDEHTYDRVEQLYTYLETKDDDSIADES